MGSKVRPITPWHYAILRKRPDVPLAREFVRYIFEFIFIFILFLLYYFSFSFYFILFYFILFLFYSFIIGMDWLVDQLIGLLINWLIG